MDRRTLQKTFEMKTEVDFCL